MSPLTKQVWPLLSTAPASVLSPGFKFFFSLWCPSLADTIFLDFMCVVCVCVCVFNVTLKVLLNTGCCFTSGRPFREGSPEGESAEPAVLPFKVGSRPHTVANGHELFEVSEERDEEVAAFCHMLDM